MKGKKKQVNIFLKVFIFMLFANVIFSPLYLYLFCENSEVIFYVEEYKKKRYKLDSISFVGGLSGGENTSSYYLHYREKKNKIRISKPGLFNFKEEKENYKYFEKTILSNYRYNQGLSENDSIWVWSNSKTSDLYATGKEKELNISVFVKRLLLYGVFLLIAMLSIHWQYRYWKKSKQRVLVK